MPRGSEEGEATTHGGENFRGDLPRLGERGGFGSGKAPSYHVGIVKVPVARFCSFPPQVS